MPEASEASYTVLGPLLRSDFAEKHVSLVRDVGWDLEGRVQVVEMTRVSHDSTGHPSAQETKGEESKCTGSLALVNVYAVNGTSSPIGRQRPEESLEQGTTTSLLSTLACADECLNLQQRGFLVVVAGDLNVARGAGLMATRACERGHTSAHQPC